MIHKLFSIGLLGLLFACGQSESPEVSRFLEMERPDTIRSALDTVPYRGGGDTSTAERSRRVVFFGTSLTAGLGLQREEHAYPGVIQEKIDLEGLDFQVVNAGVSGETSAGGLRRIDWLLRLPVDVLVIELGANDGLRGQDPEALRENLREIIRRTRGEYPEAEIVLVGMEAPPNLGGRYTEAFRTVFPEVAEETGATLVPFLLDEVGGVRELNQADGIHPNREGHRIMASTVWDVLEGVLRDRARDTPER